MENSKILERVRSCDITYHVLGKTDRSAMPMGNGELAASVWVNDKSEICFYLARTDALTEVERNVKLGMFKICFPAEQLTGEDFSQELILTEGKIQIKGKDGWADLWIDSEADVFCINGHFPEEVRPKLEYINWRTEPNVKIAEAKGYPSMAESADLVKRQENEVLFYHKNETSLVRDTARNQDVEDYIDVIPDLLLERIFGGLAQISYCKDGFELKIVTKSEQVKEETFVAALRRMAEEFPKLEESLERTAKFWNAYWCKSYIFVEHDEKKECQYEEKLKPYCKEPMEYECAMESQVTRAYVLTKYMNACCNRGAFPVLYNGMLFNLCAGGGEHFTVNNFGVAYTSQPGEFTLDHNPDERSWCLEQLWQNVRHPYYSLLERGEGEKLKGLFAYYRRFWDLNRVRAERYYGAKGQHNTEMTLSCGLQSARIYGRDRTGKKPGYCMNRWGGAVDISPGLELSNLLLDYYEFYRDETFLQENMVYIRDLLTYIETRFPKMEDGKMQIGPLNSVETYRDTINPAPVISGLRYVLERVLKFGAEHIPDFAYYEAYMEKVPEIPMGTDEKGQTVMLPAEQYTEERHNVEVVELYACYPFREYTYYKEDADMARRTYFERTEEHDIRKSFIIGQKTDVPSYSGWQNMGTVAAVLGLTDEAAEILMKNCALSNPGTRFPAMWGPIYDAVPDTDHGANILNQLQKMVMQVEDGKIHLAPALPEDWKVEFKLYSDARTCIEGLYEDGKMKYLEIETKEYT